MGLRVTLCPSMNTEAELCSGIRVPPTQGEARGRGAPASRQDHHLLRASVPS